MFNEKLFGTTDISIVIDTQQSPFQQSFAKGEDNADGFFAFWWTGVGSCAKNNEQQKDQ